MCIVSGGDNHLSRYMRICKLVKLLGSDAREAKGKKKVTDCDFD